MTLDADLANFSRQLQTLAPGTGALGPLELVDVGYGAATLRSMTGVAVRIPATEHLALRQQALSSPMRRLARLLPVPIPVPLWTIPMGHPFEHGVVGYAWIPGEPLSPATMTPAIADQLGAILAAMHAIPASALATFAGTFQNREDIDAEREIAMARALPWLTDTAGPVVADRLKRWWDSYRHARADARYTPRLVHGDLWHGNILVDPAQDRITGLIDWENVGIDDPAQDVATLLHAGEPFTGAVLDAYRRHGGEIDADLMERRRWHWEYREFSGIALALEMGDEDEARDALDKLRSGPLKALFDA